MITSIQLTRDTLINFKILTKSGRINSNYRLVDNFLEIKKMIETQTHFVLGEFSQTFRERVYCILNNIETIPTCDLPNCNHHVRFYVDGRLRNTYSKYCSVQCSSNHKDYTEVWKKANAEIIKTYKVENISQSAIIKQKKQITNLMSRGVDNPSKCALVKKQKTKTSIEHFGTDNPLQSSVIQEKIKRTNSIKYGSDHATRSSAVKLKTRTSNLLKYRRNSHMQCHISEEALSLMVDVEWLQTEHHIKQRTLSQISSELNVNVSTLSKYCTRIGVEIKHHFQSAGEKQVADFVQSLGVDVVLNSRSIISPKEIDIYIPAFNLAIEYCGIYWHSEQQGKDKWYHYNKWRECKDNNIQLLTIFEDEWLDKQQQVKQKILSLLGKDCDEVVYARNTKLIFISSTTKNSFLEKTHIQGSGPGSINIGLEYNGNLIACMSFI